MSKGFKIPITVEVAKPNKGFIYYGYWPTFTHRGETVTVIIEESGIIFCTNQKKVKANLSTLYDQMLAQLNTKDKKISENG